MRKAYPSDLTDDQWAVLEPLIPPAKAGGAPRTVNLREVVNTLFYQNRAGCQWDMLPHDLLARLHRILGERHVIAAADELQLDQLPHALVPVRDQHAWHHARLGERRLDGRLPGGGGGSRNGIECHRRLCTCERAAAISPPAGSYCHRGATQIRHVEKSDGASPIFDGPQARRLRGRAACFGSRPGC